MLDPFGNRACENELKAMGADEYSALYFHETPFDESAAREETYLVVGRRGSGKTALAQSFSFRSRHHDPLCIEVSRPEHYEQVLADISYRTSSQRTIAVHELRKVWDFVVWHLIADRLPAGGVLRQPVNHGDDASGFVANLIRYLISFFEEDSLASESLAVVVRKADLEAVKKAAFQVARTRPIIVAIDTFEQYDHSSDALMHAIAALVEYAAAFNLAHVKQNIHLKVFVSGEIFPHLRETVLLAPSKAIVHPVYMLWRPKDLLRLICWRLNCFLSSNQLLGSSAEPEWEKQDDVRKKVWEPHFGKTVTNARGVCESTWCYILRHTQMRPRQLIIICNAIANRAIREKTFPHFTNAQIVAGTKDAESELASEILSSFSAIYRKVPNIVPALMRLPMVFDGNELDRRAPQSAGEWDGNYTPANFRRLVAELGVIGRVARDNATQGFIDADFEYSMSERLDLTHHDTCVVHPMFYNRFKVEFNSRARVMPFTSRHGEPADDE